MYVERTKRQVKCTGKKNWVGELKPHGNSGNNRGSGFLKLPFIHGHRGYNIKSGLDK